MVAAGAIYPYSETLMKMGYRETSFGDTYNLFRETGVGKAKRIWVPRNMAPDEAVREYSSGLPAKFKSTFKPRNSEQARVVAEAVQLLAQGESFITECPTGFGKSSPAGTLVIMGDGTLKDVKDVKNGDVLMGPDSKPRTVSGTLKHWSPIYRITPTKGEPFECNDVHILPLKCTSDMKRSTKYRKGEITCIEVKDYIKQSKTFKHMMKLWRAPGIDLPERKVFDPYIVGLYLADGTKESSTPELSCGLVKLPALEYVESVLMVSSKVFKNGAWYYRVPSLKSVQDLTVRDGCRHIPDRNLRNSRENRLQLLAGLLDGDGHLVKNTVFELACKDESFKDEVLFLCRSLGFAAYAKLSTKGIKSTGFTGQYWVITISGDTDQIPTKIPSKQAQPRKQKKDHLVTGFTVEYVRDDWVYGFQLDGDHLYLLKDFTVSHNTACSMDIIAQVGKKTLVVVTKEDIKDQWVVAAQQFLGLSPKEIGIIQGDRFQVGGKKLVIAMIQSLAKEDRYPAHQMKEFGLVIFDETHRVAADYFSQACFRAPAKLRMGLSATPDRKDGRGETLLAHIGPVRVKTSAAPMTPRIIARMSPWKIPQTRIKTKSGYTIGPIPHSAGKCGHIINMLANHQGRNQMLTAFTVAAYQKGRNILVQSDRREHLETLAMMCQKAGIPPSEIGYYVGGLTADQREAVKHKRVIMATYQMTAEATDIPWLDTLVMGTPKSDVRQIVGRVIRIHEGKKEPIVFDVIDLSSNVFSGYWNRRREWYNSINAEISMGDR